MLTTGHLMCASFTGPLSWKKHLAWFMLDSDQKGGQFPGGPWKSPAITLDLWMTLISSPGQNGCVERWTLWHHTFLRFLPSPNSALSILPPPPHISRYFPTQSYQSIWKAELCLGATSWQTGLIDLLWILASFSSLLFPQEWLVSGRHLAMGAEFIFFYWGGY